MKNNISYILAAAAVLAMASCEEIPDYRTTIDAAPLLAYVNSGDGNWHSTTLTHRPSGTTGGYEDEIVLNSNSGNHEAVTMTLVYDASLVDEYNAANGTSYVPLPEEYLLLENPSLQLDAGAYATENAAKITLIGDLSALTERRYLGAFRVESSGMETSQEMGAYWLEVLTEINRIRPISSADEIVGYRPADRDVWTADCSGYGYLFDGNTSLWGGGSVTFDAGQVITVDMQSVNNVTGLNVTGAVTFSGIEYSTDGKTWEQAGSMISGEYVSTGSGFQVAFDGYLEARYIRFTCNSTNSWYGNTIAEFDIYKIDGTDPETPVIYAYCGTNNVLAGGTVTHHAIAGTSGSVSASFNVLTTVASASGYTVNIAVDNSLAAGYNSLHGTSYATVDASLVSLSGNPLTIASGETESGSSAAVSLTGDLSSLTDENGYIIPLQLSTSDGTLVSGSNGTVYVIVNVAFSDAKFMSDFTEDDILGTKASTSEKATWTLLACDAGGVYPDGDGTQYENLFDGERSTFVRTWGGPVDFTIDLGKVCNITGMTLTATTGYTYAPNSILIEYSTESSTSLITMDETPNRSDGTIYVSGENAYCALYEPLQVRYLRVCATYGSNMGTGEFELYVQE